jgi:hypothetical protein
MTLPPETDCGDHAKRHDALGPRLRYCKRAGVGARAGTISIEASELELKVERYLSGLSFDASMSFVGGEMVSGWRN